MERRVIGIYSVSIKGNDYGYIRFPVVTERSYTDYTDTYWFLEAIVNQVGYLRYGKWLYCDLTPILEGGDWKFELIDSYEEYTV